MTELQNRLQAMIGKWIARAEELEREADELAVSGKADSSIMARVQARKLATAQTYRANAIELAKEAGLLDPKEEAK